MRSYKNSKNLLRKIFKSVFAFSFIVYSSSCTNSTKQENDFTQIQNVFTNAPDSLKTSVYWYWISDNISREGVIKDLHAMKAQGINRAFIGNIGLNPGEAPYGKVKLFSTEWWDILHTALKTATELNIEIGIFNSPGWSQSGGPWVKPEQAMRYLAFSETKVKGSQKLQLKLEQPKTNFQDVKVLAFKQPLNIEKSFAECMPQFRSEKPIAELNKLFDNDDNTTATIPAGEQQIDIFTESPYEIRTLRIKTATGQVKCHADFYAQIGNQYRLLKSFEIDRTNPNLIVGFDPYAPIVISIPYTMTSGYRLVLSKLEQPAPFAEISLISNPMEERYPEKSLAKMFQTPLPYWADYMWPDQPQSDRADLAINPDSVIDLSDKVDHTGNLIWDVPEGNWIILRTGMTPTGVVNEPASPEGTGLEIDKMSKEHLASHFNAFLGEIMRRIPAEDRKTWKVVVEDSYERGGQNWTDTFIQNFTGQYGYSPVPFIPVMKGYVVGSHDLSDRFLWDLRRLVADKIAYDYVGGLRELSHKNGFTTWLENYGHWGFPGEFLQYGGQSDEVGGEFWSEGELGNIENRAASSCAHIYGKQKVSAESFTCGGKAYSRSFQDMKQRGDRFFTEGINNTLLHVYIEQPDERVPGQNAGFGNEFNRHNTWFSQLNLFTTYLKRSNFMLQQGKYVADIAYFIGEDVPKMTGICDPALPLGYSFDYINAEVIMSRLSVMNGFLVLPDGMKYKMLVLPKLKTMRPELLSRINELINQGAVVFGPAPEKSPSLQNYPVADSLVNTLATQMWAGMSKETFCKKNLGNGLIYNGPSLQNALSDLNIQPDFTRGTDDNILFIHRTLPTAEIYFVSNQNDQKISFDPTFRVLGLQPELWDAVTGKIRTLPEYTFKDGRTTVPLTLEAFESAFIVFKDKTGKPGIQPGSENFPEPEVLLTLTNQWTVIFDKDRWGPARPIVFNTLEDWTQNTNDSIKYYSGTAIYQTKFDLNVLPEKGHLFLNLGQVSVVAKIKINGQDAGGVWTAPWQVDITNLIKTGENTLEIKVVNNWMNRLIGDLKLPVAKHKTWSNVIPYTAESPLQSSGLVGPVTLIKIND